VARDVRERIGVGIIGLGASRGWAARAHLPALRASSDFEVRAASASTPERGAEAARVHGVPVACADAEELVTRTDVSLVVVTVKVPQHRRLVSLALEAGKSVLCEWPLARSEAEAAELTALAGHHGVPAFVGLQARSAPAVRFVRGLVESGSIGEVLSTTVVGSGGQWGATADPDNLYLLDRANGATMLTIPVGHTIDAVCDVLGPFATLTATTATRRQTVPRRDTGEVVRVTAEDQVVVSGVLATGAVAAVHYRGGRSGGTEFLWEINGTAGDIVVRGDTGHLQYGLVDVSVTDAARRLVPTPVPSHCRRSKVDPVEPGHTVAEAYVEIAAALRGQPSSAPTFADGLRLHQVLAAIERSAAEPRPTL
jgi:predicted dehydrogenase